MGKDQGPVSGRYTLWDIDAYDHWTPLFSRQNTLMTTWGFAAARLFGYGDTSYKISRIYVEYENVASPGDAVAVPTFDVDDGRAYYDNLVAPQDYLRIPLSGLPDTQIASGFENVFTEDVDGNKLIFAGQTSGTAGENSVAFSDSVNSKVFGLALVAAPDDADKTKDVIVSRGYYPTADQKVKQASGQIGVTWELIFKPQA